MNKKKADTMTPTEALLAAHEAAEERQTTSGNEALDRITSLRQQIAKEIQNVKLDLAKHLDKACQTLKVLQGLGEKSILRTDPQLSEFVAVLESELSRPDMAAPAEPRAAGRARARRTGGKVTTEAAILQALESGNTFDNATLFDRASEIKGQKISRGSFNLTLMKLKKAKKMVTPQRGKYKLA